MAARRREGRSTSAASRARRWRARGRAPAGRARCPPRRVAPRSSGPRSAGRAPSAPGQPARPGREPCREGLAFLLVDGQQACGRAPHLVGGQPELRGQPHSLQHEHGRPGRGRRQVGIRAPVRTVHQGQRPTAGDRSHGEPAGRARPGRAEPPAGPRRRATRPPARTRRSAGQGRPAPRPATPRAGRPAGRPDRARRPCRRPRDRRPSGAASPPLRRPAGARCCRDRRRRAGDDGRCRPRPRPGPRAAPPRVGRAGRPGRPGRGRASPVSVPVHGETSSGTPYTATQHRPPQPAGRRSGRASRCSTGPRYASASGPSRPCHQPSGVSARVARYQSAAASSATGSRTAATRHRRAARRLPPPASRRPRRGSDWSEADLDGPHRRRTADATRLPVQADPGATALRRSGRRRDPRPRMSVKVRVPS